MNINNYVNKDDKRFRNKNNIINEIYNSEKKENNHPNKKVMIFKTNQPCFKINNNSFYYLSKTSFREKICSNALNIKKISSMELKNIPKRLYGKNKRNHENSNFIGCYNNVNQNNKYNTFYESFKNDTKNSVNSTNNKKERYINSTSPKTIFNKKMKMNSFQRNNNFQKNLFFMPSTTTKDEKVGNDYFIQDELNHLYTETNHNDDDSSSENDDLKHIKSIYS